MPDCMPATKVNCEGNERRRNQGEQQEQR